MIIDNFEIDEFQLLAGAPIKVPGLELKIHQPKLYEIANIGEELFYNYLSFFKIGKDVIIDNIEDPQQKIELELKTEYEVLKLLMINQEEVEIGIREVLNLLIKDMEIIKFNESFIFLKSKEGQQHIINDYSFSLIKEIIYKIFNLNPRERVKAKEFNPSNEIASDIAEKLRKRREALEKANPAKETQGKKDQSILTDFVSILAVGLSLSITQILNLTVYQIFNLMKRFGLYSQYQLQVKAMLQGAENVELVDWFQKI